MKLTKDEKIEGVLIGTAVGDALGLPAEGLSPKRIDRMWHGTWRMRLVLGRGIISDDTEHTMMVPLENVVGLEVRNETVSDAAAFCAWCASIFVVTIS